MISSMITALPFNKTETFSNSMECSFVAPAKTCSTHSIPEVKTLISDAKDAESDKSTSRTDNKIGVCFTVSPSKQVRLCLFEGSKKI